jgi:hypothetical protein
MKKSVLIAVTVLLVNILIAGNSDKNRDTVNSRLVSGKVIDKKSGEEIAGAEVRINDKIVYTNLSGNFSASMSTSETSILISFISYSDTTINIDPFSFNDIVVELESK